MKSYFHAYQAYEKQVEKGVYVSSIQTSGPSAGDHLLASTGDLLIRIGNKMRERYETKHTLSGSPVLGKLNR